MGLNIQTLSDVMRQRGAEDSAMQGQQQARDMQKLQMMLTLKKLKEEADMKQQTGTMLKDLYRPEQPASAGTMGYGLGMGNPNAQPQLKQLMEQGGDFGMDNMGAINSSAEFSNKGAPVPMMAPQAAQAGGIDPMQLAAGFERMAATTGNVDFLTKAQELRKAMQKEGFTLGEGQSRFGAAGNIIANVAKAPKEEKMTDVARLISEMNALPPNSPLRKVYQNKISKETTHAPPTQIQNYPAPIPVMDAEGNTKMVQFGNKGDTRETPYKPPTDTKPPTEFEGKAAFYAQNMSAATKALQDLEAEGFDPTSMSAQASTALAGGKANAVVNEKSQKARQAQRQWSEQMLRMQTGAAATTDEIDRTNKTYFPQIGDTAKVVEQKRKMREQAEQGVFSAAGRAQKRVPQQTQQSGAPKPGTLKDGYLFLGGDPSDQSRWKKAGK